MNIKEINKIMNSYKYLDLETLDYVDKPKFFDDQDVIIDELDEEGRNEFFKNQTVIELDASVAESVRILNKKGYVTYSCCGGHISPESLISGLPIISHINFMGYSLPKNINLPNGFIKNGKYQIITIERVVIPKNKYKKSKNKKYCGIELTDKELMNEYNNLANVWIDLMDWAKSLPYNN